MYDNTNSGLLARNERKETENHPDYTGTINADGVDYWVSAWVKTGREGSKMEGKKFFSISLKRKDEQARSPQRNQPAAPQRQAQPQRQPRQQVIPQDDLDDDIPF